MSINLAETSLLAVIGVKDVDGVRTRGAERKQSGALSRSERGTGRASTAKALHCADI